MIPTNQTSSRTDIHNLVSFRDRVDKPSKNSACGHNNEARFTNLLQTLRSNNFQSSIHTSDINSIQNGREISCDEINVAKFIKNQSLNEVRSALKLGCRIFLGGLNPETDEEQLVNYFSTFSNVESAMIIRESVSLKSRRFGFVTFEQPWCVDKILDYAAKFNGRVKIDGFFVELKTALPANTASQSSIQTSCKPSQKMDRRKVFVGGLAPYINETDLINFFGKFGQILRCSVVNSHADNKKRGFGFILFESENVANHVVQIHYHIILKRRVEVKFAIPVSMMSHDQHVKFSPLNKSKTNDHFNKLSEKIDNLDIKNIPKRFHNSQSPSENIMSCNAKNVQNNDQTTSSSPNSEMSLQASIASNCSRSSSKKWGQNTCPTKNISCGQELPSNTNSLSSLDFITPVHLSENSSLPIQEEKQKTALDNYLYSLHESVKSN